MRTATQPIAFAPAASATSVHAPTFLTRALGVVIGAIMLVCVFVLGFTSVQDDGIGIWFVLGGGLLLIVTAWQNWRMLWNAFGRLMRYLVGERAARFYFALTGVVFALGGLLATVASAAAMQ